MNGKVVGIVAILVSAVVVAGSVTYGNQVRDKADRLVAQVEDAGHSVNTEWTQASDRDFASEIKAADAAGKEVAEGLMAYTECIKTGAGKEERQGVLADKIRANFVNGENVPGDWFSSDNENLTWTWNPVSSYEFTSNGVKYLWTCQDSDGHLLAYASSEYKFQDGLFTNPVIRSTDYGNKNISVEGLPSDGYDTDQQKEVEDSVNSILDAIKNNNVGPGYEFTPEDEEAMGQNNQAKQDLYEEWLKQQEQGGTSNEE